MKLNEPSWPKGTNGYNMENEFINTVRRLKDIGYGRMIQMIKFEWDEMVKKDIEESNKPTGEE